MRVSMVDGLSGRVVTLVFQILIADFIIQHIIDTFSFNIIHLIISFFPAYPLYIFIHLPIGEFDIDWGLHENFSARKFLKLSKTWFLSWRITMQGVTIQYHKKFINIFMKF